MINQFLKPTCLAVVTLLFKIPLERLSYNINSDSQN